MSNYLEHTITSQELRQVMLTNLDTTKQTIVMLSYEELGAVVGGEMTNSQAALIGAGVAGGTALGRIWHPLSVVSYQVAFKGAIFSDAEASSAAKTYAYDIGMEECNLVSTIKEYKFK